MKNTLVYELIDTLIEMQEALQGLYPFCHEDGMLGESAWEQAWLKAEAALRHCMEARPYDIQ